MKDKSIYIKNIYYMLSYAFQVLNRGDYENITPEAFESVENLFAAILYKGVSQIIKQGLYKEYIDINGDLTTIRGRINMSGTIKKRIANKKEVNCDYDELSVNNKYNQVITTTIHYLVKSRQVSKDLKKSLNKCQIAFQNVDVINDLSLIKWGSFRYHTNNRIYEMILNICYFVTEGMIQTENKGKYKVVSFSDNMMEKVYEKFILEYYRKHYKGVLTSNAEQIKWNVDEKDKDKSILGYWNTMQTDITLNKDSKTLIIDAKYYTNVMDYRYSKRYHSYNLYQIYTYVKNYDKNKTGNVAGVLLYAKTDEELPPSEPISIDGNVFSVEVLDLYQDFNIIKNQLDELVTKYLR